MTDNKKQDIQIERIELGSGNLIKLPARPIGGDITFTFNTDTVWEFSEPSPLELQTRIENMKNRMAELESALETIEAMAEHKGGCDDILYVVRQAKDNK